MRVVFCILALYAASCAKSSIKPEPPRRTGQPLTLSVQVEVSSPYFPQKLTIAPGDTLHSGDSFAVMVWVDRPAYVTTVQYSPTGWSRLLNSAEPKSSASTLEPFRIPEGTEAFKLDDAPGDEYLIILASMHPLDSAQAKLLRLPPPIFETSLNRGGSSPPPPPPPPDGVSAGRRDGELLFRQNRTTLRKVADDTGTALLRFAFKHAASGG